LNTCAPKLGSVSSKSLRSIFPSGGGNRSAKSLRVLIADADRDDANMLALALRDEGNEVVIALRGDEALELSRLLRPDVLIRHGNLAPLLIAISGVWTNPSDRVLGQAAGFDHYSVKPVDLEKILRLIDAARGVAAGSG
jgi:DNA-binding response OmpR family regulator